MGNIVSLFPTHVCKFAITLSILHSKKSHGERLNYPLLLCTVNALHVRHLVCFNYLFTSTDEQVFLRL